VELALRLKFRLPLSILVIVIVNAINILRVQYGSLCIFWCKFKVEASQRIV
jgi:hypothetical protein